MGGLPPPARWLPRRDRLPVCVSHGPRPEVVGEGYREVSKLEVGGPRKRNRPGEALDLDPDLPRRLRDVRDPCPASKRDSDCYRDGALVYNAVGVHAGVALTRTVELDRTTKTTPARTITNRIQERLELGGSLLLTTGLPAPGPTSV